MRVAVVSKRVVGVVTGWPRWFCAHPELGLAPTAHAHQGPICARSSSFLLLGRQSSQSFITIDALLKSSSHCWQSAITVGTMLCCGVSPAASIVSFSPSRKKKKATLSISGTVHQCAGFHSQAGTGPRYEAILPTLKNLFFCCLHKAAWPHFWHIATARRQNL